MGNEELLTEAEEVSTKIIGKHLIPNGRYIYIIYVGKLVFLLYKGSIFPSFSFILLKVAYM